MVARQSRLRIATYNVHRGVGTDRRYRPERVAVVIRELNADILGLQEVTWSHVDDGGPMQFDYFAAATGLTVIVGPNIREHRGHYGNVLLTRLPALAVRRVDLSVSGYEPRGALDVDLDGGPTPLRVIVTHLGLRRRERHRQVRMLRALIDDGRGHPTILLGDFNEWLPRSSLRPIVAACGRTAAPRTYPSWRPMFALDRIWMRPGAALSAIDAHTTPTARLASDHLPVAALVDRTLLPPRRPRG